MTVLSERLSVAPMMEWTDRHFRYFMRRLTRRTVLYTEMVAAPAAVFGNAERLLGFDPDEKPLVLQLGGADPELLAEACRIAAGFDYDGLNLNAGCPSERVSAGCFGAALRRDPGLIVECLAAMQENSRVPVSLKTRIALEEMTPDSDGYDDLAALAERLEKTGCRSLIIHARKARLKGFTPKQNRERPALRPDLVYRLKQDFPHFNIVLNGSVSGPAEAREHLTRTDGVMIGRAAYASPYLMAEADSMIFGDSRPPVSAVQAVLDMEPYITDTVRKGVGLNSVTRHMLGLFRGRPGGAAWRRILSEKAGRPGADFKTVAEALDKVISSSETV